MFYIKKRDSPIMYVNKQINDVVNNLIEIQNASKAEREIFCHHIATVLGFNITKTNSARRAWQGSQYGTHAEMAVLRHLPNNSRKKVISIDILVIRTTASGELRNSKPCAICLKHMSRVHKYRVRNVFYSDDNGHIVCDSFNNLSKESNKYYCRSQRKEY